MFLVKNRLFQIIYFYKKNHIPQILSLFDIEYIYIYISYIYIYIYIYESVHGLKLALVIISKRDGKKNA